jgi:hypothetical protein
MSMVMRPFFVSGRNYFVNGNSFTASASLVNHRMLDWHGPRAGKPGAGSW